MSVKAGEGPPLPGLKAFADMSAKIVSFFGGTAPLRSAYCKLNTEHFGKGILLEYFLNI